jgi:Xaa-Pro aminopeptidase
VDKLIIAPGTDPDHYYASGLALGDPFITLIRGNKRYCAAGGFEYMQVAAKHPTTRFEDLGKGWKAIIKAFLAKHKVKSPVMPANTAARFYKLVPKATLTNEFFTERAVKTATEIKHIKSAQVATEAAISAVRDVLAKSTVVNKKAKYKGQWLTSEYLKRVAAVELAKHNCACPDMIISSGKQTAVPHDRGSGVIREGAVIVDIFPQSNETRYFADCTRTFVVGKAPKTFEERYNAVLAVQEAGLRAIHHGTDLVDKQTRPLFNDLGFKTDLRAGKGYIHGLGHGVGLEIHEEPRLSQKLTAGNVITIEPGLYYDYGIRIEDIGVVTKKGFTNFTKLDKNPYL